MTTGHNSNNKTPADKTAAHNLEPNQNDNNKSRMATNNTCL